MSEQNWRILLIGGSSGTGKTSLAQRLSQHFGVGLLLADDVRIALQSVTTAEQLPALHYFFTHDDVLWHQPPAAWQAGWTGVGEVVTRALAQVVAHHVVVRDAGALIIEGDSILPQGVLQIQRELPKPEHAPQVRALFLYEPEQAALLHNLRRKTDRGFPTAPPDRQQTFVNAAWHYGLWLKAEAERAGFPTLAARPWATLDARVLGVLTQP